MILVSPFQHFKGFFRVQMHFFLILRYLNTSNISQIFIFSHVINPTIHMLKLLHYLLFLFIYFLYFLLIYPLCILLGEVFNLKLQFSNLFLTGKHSQLFIYHVLYFSLYFPYIFWFGIFKQFFVYIQQYQLVHVSFLLCYVKFYYLFFKNAKTFSYY